MTKMSPEARAEIEKSFGLDAVHGTLLVRGNFNPKCATDTDLEKLKLHKKEAEVFSGRRSTVYLNCGDPDSRGFFDREVVKHWKQLFKSEADGDRIFFIHEGLRVAGIEEEDDYNKSSKAWLSSTRVENAKVHAMVANLMDGKNSKCSVGVDYENFPAEHNSSRRLYYFTINYSGKRIFVSTKRNLFYDNEADIRINPEKLYQIASDIGCFNKSLTQVVDPNSAVASILDSARSAEDPRVTDRVVRSATVVGGSDSDASTSKTGASVL